MPNNKQATDYIVEKKYAFASIEQAKSASFEVGCMGFHTSNNGKHYPCKSRTELLKLLNIPGSEQMVLKASNQETVDYAVLKWVDETLNVHSDTNDGFKKVPIIWLTAERSFLVKSSRELRQPDSDALIFPLISIKRDNMERTQANARPIPGNLFKQKVNGLDYSINQFYIGKKILQDKTNNFAKADSLRLHNPDKNFPTPKNQRVVYKRYYVPLPIYYNMTYSINLRADYQAQLNQMIQPFLTYSNNITNFMIYSRNHKYEAFFESITFEDNVDNLAEEEKKYEASVKVKVLGYIMGEGVNSNIGDYSTTENQVKVVFPREHVIIGDINEFGDGFFKE